MAIKKKKIKVEEVKKLPEPQLGGITFMMSAEEVFSLAQILSFSRDVFKQMSLERGTAGDTKAETVYASRSELSDVLYSKVLRVAGIGEPDSRVFH